MTCRDRRAPGILALPLGLFDSATGEDLVEAQSPPLAVTENSPCLLKGNSMVCNNQSHSRASP
jgi:hypothetical protein